MVVGVAVLVGLTSPEVDSLGVEKLRSWFLRSLVGSESLGPRVWGSRGPGLQGQLCVSFIMSPFCNISVTFM